MSAKLWKAGTVNAFQTTLNGSVTAGDNTITLTSVTGLQAPGILCIDRVNNVGVSTPTTREYISFTGISTNTLTGVVRGLAGSSDQDHGSGAIIEENFSVSHWGDLVTFLQAAHDASGNIVVSGTATIGILKITTLLDAAGASILGTFPIHPVFVIPGNVSLATTSVGKPLPLPSGGQWKFFSAVLRTPTSGASLIIDINKNGTSIFTDQNTRLLIPTGGTYISTASIGTLGFSSGDILTVDIDAGGGSALDLTILGRGA